MRLLAIGLGVALCACGTDDNGGDGTGSGTARFTVYGEDFVEQGIPATEFSDGWSATPLACRAVSEVIGAKT